MFIQSVAHNATKIRYFSMGNSNIGQVMFDPPCTTVITLSQNSKYWQHIRKIFYSTKKGVATRKKNQYYYSHKCILI